jgi:hypothetical protein
MCLPYPTKLYNCIEHQNVESGGDYHSMLATYHVQERFCASLLVVYFSRQKTFCLSSFYAMSSR